MLDLETGYYSTFFGEKSEAQVMKNSMLRLYMGLSRIYMLGGVQVS